MDQNPVESPRYTAMLYFLGRYKLWLVAILSMTVVSTAVDSLSIVAFFPMLSSLLSNSQEDAGGILGFMIRLVELVPISNPIISASVLLILVFSVKTIITLLREIVTAQAAARVHYDVTKEIMDRYSNAHYQYILDNQQGTLLYNSLTAPTSVPGLLNTVSRMATALFTTLTIIVILISILPFAALALIVLGVAYYTSMHYLSKKISYHLGVLNAAGGMEKTVIVNEFLNGFRQIVILNVAKWWTDKFDHVLRILRGVEVKQAVWQAVPRPTMELSAVLVMLGLILIISLSSSGGVIDSLPTVGVFAVALTRLMPPLTTVGTLRMRLMTILPNLELAYGVVTGPVPTRIQGHRELESFQKAIEFNNVSFSYRDREPLFDGLDVTFEKGAVTAIVGPSGAGKTSIINLILGLFEPTRGTITVDGIPLQEIRQETWLSKIGFVSQEPFTYHATVSENVLLGRSGRSQEAIYQAAKTANAHEFVSQLPDDYGTVVGERGMKLSGGQQQRLAIARAILDSPEILIFDEATSNLDNISERLVQEAIRSVAVSRTVILIAHRLSSISHADKIIVFEDGRVIEQGTHQELLDKGGHYSQQVGAAT